MAREEGIAVHKKRDPEHDVGVVDIGQNIHHPRTSIQEELLDGELNVDRQLVFESQNLNRMALGSPKNGFIPRNESGRDSSAALVYLFQILESNSQRSTPHPESSHTQ